MSKETSRQREGPGRQQGLGTLLPRLGTSLLHPKPLAQCCPPDHCPPAGFSQPPKRWLGRRWLRGLALGTGGGWREGCNVPSSLKESCGLLYPSCGGKLSHCRCCDRQALSSFVGSSLERRDLSSPLLTLLLLWVPVNKCTLIRSAWKDDFWFQ